MNSRFLATLAAGALLAGSAVAQEPPVPGTEQDTAAKSMNVDIDVVNMPIDEVMDLIGRQVNKNILVNPTVKELVTERLRDINWRDAVELIAKQYNCEVEERHSGLLLTQPPKVTIQFTDANVRTVLQLLAAYSGKNIIISPAIEGRVTLDLKEVHWLKALRAIVETSGPYAVVSVDDDLLRIVLRESIEQELETVVYPLKYVRPPPVYRAVPPRQSGNQAAAAVFVGKLPTQNVTDPRQDFTLFRALQLVVAQSGIDGAILEYDLSTNAFILTAPPNLTDQIKKIIDKVDVEPAQLHCEVRFVATKDNNFEKVGIEFAEGAERDGLRFAGPFVNNRNVTVVSPFQNPDPVLFPNTGGIDNSNTIDRFSGEYPFILGDSMDDITKPFGIPSIMDFTGLNMALNMVTRDERSRLVQSPSLFLMDNTDAVIFVGENVPYAQLQTQPDANGNIVQTLTEGIDSPVAIGFSLFLQPHVIPNSDRVVMTVIPRVNDLIGTTSEIPGFERFGFGQLEINLPRTREQAVVSHVMLNDTQTAVLGGLRTENKIEIIKAVPILSSIPIIGNLFKTNQITNEVENLTVFISPTIVRQSNTVNSIFFRATRRLEADDYFYKRTDAPTEDEHLDALEEGDDSDD